MRRFEITASFLALSAIFHAGAVAKPVDCLSESEGAAFVSAIIPELINSARKTCAPALSPSSYLATNGSQLETQYRAFADTQWPEAKKVFGKISGESEMLSMMGDEFFRTFITSAMATEIGSDIKKKDCQGIDLLLKSLAPLPPQNLVMVFSAVMLLAQKGKGGNDAMKMCKAT